MDRRVWHDRYDEGVPPDFQFVERTLPQALERSAANRGDRTAIWFVNRRLTYRELKEQVDRLATALSRLGVTRGTRVALQLPNLPQTVIANYAVLRLGANVVMTSPLYTEREIEHQWKDAGCEVAILTDFIWMQRVRMMRGRLPVKQYVIASIPEYLMFPLNLLAPLKLRKTKPPTVAAVPREDGVHKFRELLDRKSVV